MSNKKIAIKRFRGNYFFLDNFYPCLVEFEGIIYPSVEHAFQAAKTLDIDERKTFAVCPTCKDVKRMGRKVKLRSDWESVKIDVMRKCVKDKFTRNLAYNIDLKQSLLDTENMYLEEGNSHGDRFWGTVNGQGRNELGKVLMEVRSEIREGE